MSSADATLGDRDEPHKALRADEPGGVPLLPKDIYIMIIALVTGRYDENHDVQDMIHALRRVCKCFEEHLCAVVPINNALEAPKFLHVRCHEWAVSSTVVIACGRCGTAYSGDAYFNPNVYMHCGSCSYPDEARGSCNKPSYLFRPKGMTCVRCSWALCCTKHTRCNTCLNTKNGIFNQHYRGQLGMPAVDLGYHQDIPAPPVEDGVPVMEYHRQRAAKRARTSVLMEQAEHCCDICEDD